MSGRRKPKSFDSAPKSKKKAAGAKAYTCFVESCTSAFTNASDLAHHYETVFSTNNDVHVAALTAQLDPRFSSPGTCHVCGGDFPHAGLLLQHVFKFATEAPRGMPAVVARESCEMHTALFQSFVQELITMPTVEREEAIEYLVSLVIPGDDEDEDDEEEEDEYENGEFEFDEDDDDGDDGMPSMSEMAEFEDFLSMHGLDMDSMGGPGSAKEKAAFMKHFMAQMAGEFEEDEDMQERPKKGKKGAKAAPAKGAAGKNAKKAASTPAEAGKPGELQCGSCNEFRPKSMYSAAQLKKKSQRRCKQCVDGPAASSAGAPKSAAAATPAAHSSATAAAASTTAAPAHKPSDATNHARQHTHHHQQRRHHHHQPPRNPDGTEIQEEPEETGDGEHEFATESDEEEDVGADEEEEEVDSDEELYEDDDDDDGDDPFSAFFGGGRGGSRRKKATAESSRDARASMKMHVLIERPGQVLSLDRRLRLKASPSFPIRCYQPNDADVTCVECRRSIPSRIVQAWKLVCFECGVRRRWIRDEDRFHRDDDEDGAGRAAHEQRIRSAEHIALQASRFPNYRAGVSQCVRQECASDRMLLVYDEAGDEWIICVACGGSKQKLRYFDANHKKLIDGVQEPLLQHD